MMRKVKSGVIAVLDLGATHIDCAVARVVRDGPMSAPSIHVLGASHVESQGVGATGITDLKSAEKAIRIAIDSAEKRAEVTLDSIVVGANIGRPTARLVTTEIDMVGKAVGTRELNALENHARRDGQEERLKLLHFNRRYYIGDNEDILQDPLGIRVGVLAAEHCLVEVEAHAWANLQACVESTHLKLQQPVLATMAAAAASVSEDEFEQGVICIDMGGAATAFALYCDGAIQTVGQVRVGAHHITRDISLGLNITIEDAERLKMMNGNAMANPLYGGGDVDATLHARPVGGGGMDVPIRQHDLNQILCARVDEILDLLETEFDGALHNGRVRNIVITGGGARLNGMELLMQNRFGVPVRLGRPQVIRGMPEVLSGPSGCVLTGLLLAVADTNQAKRAGLVMPEDLGVFGRLKHWWSENFY